MRSSAKALLAASVLLLSGCGGVSEEQRAQDRFGEYTAAEVERGEAEASLNQAFRDISKAARAHDRTGVVGAARRGRTATAAIRKQLDAEIAAVDELVAAYVPTSGDARRLGAALRRSRDGLRPIERQLEIALADPFLDRPENAAAISRLSQESLRKSVPAAFARREAARAIALLLGIEPPFDAKYDGSGRRPEAQSGKSSSASVGA